MFKKYVLIPLIIGGFFWPVSGYSSPSDKPEIWTSLPPLAWLTQQVAGDTIRVQSLLKPGQNPHIFSPRPKELTPVKSAQFFFHCGTDFEQMLAQKIHAMSPKIKVQNIWEHTDNPEEKNQEPQADHTDHTCGDHHHGHNCASHAGGKDPHVWMAPQNLASMATNINTSLASQFPDKKKIFEENLSRLVERLSALDKECASRLAPVKGTTFYVHHPAFGHFAERYGLIQKAVEVEGKSPTPKQLLALINSAKKESVRTIVASPQFSDRSSKILAQKIGGTVVKVDPLNPNPLGTIRQLTDALLGEKQSTSH